MFKLALDVFLIMMLFLSGCCLTDNKVLSGNAPLTPFASQESAACPLLKMDMDLTKVVLHPKDLAGLFSPTYALLQKIDTAKVKGLIVTYQTESIPHTLAFAKGYSTRIEVFENEDTARATFLKKRPADKSTPLDLNPIGDESWAARSNINTPEGFEVPGNQYSLVFRHCNALVEVVVKTNQILPPHRLETLGRLILNRLQKPIA